MENTDYTTTIGRLATAVRTAILPLVDSDYVLLDCPYHYNIGDSLIWQGELDLLKGSPHRMLSHSSVFTRNDRTPIDPSTLILLHGGGNFGDLWRLHTLYRLEVTARYPGNRIVVLPQTVHYADPEIMKADAEAFSRHPNLTLCARDERSYAILKENFANPALLVPDSAFCIDMGRFRSLLPAAPSGTLYLKRRDRELAASGAAIPAGADVRDWPSSNKWSRAGLTFFLLRGAAIAFRGEHGRRGAFRRAAASSADNFALRHFLPHAVETGVRFIGSYERIYTTRLHGAILSMLCDRPFSLVDNSYGKNSSFFETWL